MLCGIASADTDGAGGEKARGQRQPGPCAAVRGVLGTVRFAEHSCRVIAADSGDWTVVVRGDGSAATAMECTEPAHIRNAVLLSTNPGNPFPFALPPLAPFPIPTPLSH